MHAPAAVVLCLDQVIVVLTQLLSKIKVDAPTAAAANTTSTGENAKSTEQERNQEILRATCTVIHVINTPKVLELINK